MIVEDDSFIMHILTTQLNSIKFLKFNITKCWDG